MLDPEESLPAPGQGALGIECLEQRADLIELLDPLNDQEARWCVRAERAVSRALSGSCVVPLGAYAQPLNRGAWLRAFVASPDGVRHAYAEEQVSNLNGDPDALGLSVVQRLDAAGAREILAALPHA